MALDKAIKFRKEHRKPYRGSKAIDGSCRNHGGCPWCERNRKHKFRDKHPPEKGADVFDYVAQYRHDFQGKSGFKMVGVVVGVHSNFSPFITICV